MIRRLTVAGASLAAVLALSGCMGGTPQAIKDDQRATNAQLDRYQRNQPVPASDWSQYRQTIIDVTNAQIHGVATTTFFFNMGVQEPIRSCPSIGFPVPTTAQLTNPEQKIGEGGGGGGNVTLAQQEPNGVYTGDSSGTYVVCVGAGGKKGISYWEGDVQTEGGPAHWDKASGQIVADGAPTVTATTK